MTKKLCLLIFLFFLVINFIIFASNKHNTLLQILSHLDSGFYAHIATNGYNKIKITVFYPLFPMLIKIISSNYFNPVIVGAIVSSLIYVFLIINWIKHIPVNHLSNIQDKYFFLMPQNYLGILLFVFGPCSYIFLTNHTESLFLLLSYLSFSYLYKSNYLKSSIFVGLAMLTKNQGIFIFILAIIILIENNFNNPRGLFKNLAIFSLVSLIIFANWPIYLWYKFKDPISFYHQQAAWHKVTSISEYLKTFVFANAWQNLRVNSILHECWFMFFFVCAVLALLNKYYKIALYTLLVIVIIPFQGELVTDYRFTIFCYPTYFFIGKYLEDRFGARIYFILIPIGILSFSLTYAYAIGRWAY